MKIWEVQLVVNKLKNTLHTNILKHSSGFFFNEEGKLERSLYEYYDVKFCTEIYKLVVLDTKPFIKEDEKEYIICSIALIEELTEINKSAILNSLRKYLINYIRSSQVSLIELYNSDNIDIKHNYNVDYMDCVEKFDLR